VLIQARQLAHLVVPDATKVVSLDLFDTLLIRNVDPPEVAIRLVAERVAAQKLLPQTASAYLKLRGRVEAELRARAGEGGDDPECSILEISRRMVEMLRFPPETADLLVDAELAVEALLLDASPEVLALIRRLGSRCRLVAISDTYFTADHLSRLLDAMGLAGCFARIYASCDYRRTKRSGRLYDFVLAEEKLHPRELLHIGDNFHGDCLSARVRGVTALCLYDWPTLIRKRSLRRALTDGTSEELYRLYFSNGGQPSAEDGALYRFGREVMGPLLTLFSARLLEELAESDCRSVFFVARDSYLLQKLYRQMAPLGVDRELAYIGLSRYTAALASIRVLGAREVVLAGFACNCLRDALHRLGVGALPEIEPLLAEHGMSSDERIGQEPLYQALTVLFRDERFRRPVFAAASTMRQSLGAYLEQKGFFAAGRPTALVDIGWHGSIQECLHTAFGGRPDFPRLTGYYFALMPPVLAHSGARKGLILDYRGATPGETALALYQELWELSTRAFHGTTVGYRECAGHLLPLLKEERGGHREQLNRSVLEIQRGILDCAGDFARIADLLPAELSTLKEVAVSRFDAAISFPERRYVELFQRCFHSDDFGLERMTPLVRKFAWRELLAPGRFLEEFLDNPWREASLVSSRLPFLSLYHAAKRFICWQRAARHYSP
jgi:FMN phosphatase YigB (HAD superfamily)